MILKGVLFALVSIVPHNALIVPATLLACVSALSFALATVRRRLAGGGIGVYPKFIGMTFLSILSSIILLLAALVEAYITPVFIELATRYLI